MKLAWLTDIHLNFLDQSGVDSFFHGLARLQTDAILLSGDIGEAHDVLRHLEAFAVLGQPVYFVLGNHDYYRGSITDVRKAVDAVCAAHPTLHWLSKAGVVPLTAETGLIGHEGWGDARLGDYWGSTIELTDWLVIEDFKGLDREARLAKLQELGDEAGAHFRRVLPAALTRFRHLLVVTHVPPFRESCWYRGRNSGDDWLPHFTCKAAGDALLEAMRTHPVRRMTILCGHTHGSGEADVLPNLHVSTGGAVYGHPRVQRVIEVE